MARTTRDLGVNLPDLEIPAEEEEVGGGTNGVQLQGDDDVVGEVGGDDPTDEVLSFYKGTELDNLNTLANLTFRYALLWISAVGSKAGHPTWRL